MHGQKNKNKKWGKTQYSIICLLFIGDGSPRTIIYLHIVIKKN